VCYDRLLFLPADEKALLALDVDVVVDDHPGTLEDFARRGVLALTLKYPWNDTPELSRHSHLVVRCDDWPEIHARVRRVVDTSWPAQGKAPPPNATHECPSPARGPESRSEPRTLESG
jgi:hypothetical protein